MAYSFLPLSFTSILSAIWIFYDFVYRKTFKPVKNPKTKCYIGHKRGQYRKILTLIDKDKIVDKEKNFQLLEYLLKYLF